MNRVHPSPRGDEAELFSRLHRILERAVRAPAREPAVCVEDACAYACEQFLRTQPGRGDERLLGWLVTVAVREGWRLVRVEQRTPATDPGALEHLGEVATDPDLEARAWALEAPQALAGLRPAERRLLTLRAVGYSYREVRSPQARDRLLSVRVGDASPLRVGAPGPRTPHRRGRGRRELLRR
jgi:DNA-directed RNA polymerase specialized sigma24 family protein